MTPQQIRTLSVGDQVEYFGGGVNSGPDPNAYYVRGKVKDVDRYHGSADVAWEDGTTVHHTTPFLLSYVRLAVSVKDSTVAS